MLDKSKGSHAFFSSELFAAVQSSALFLDSKTFADATPNRPFSEIEKRYVAESKNTDFDLEIFVHKYFSLPKTETESQRQLKDTDALSYIRNMWAELLRQPDKNTADTLIPLPHAYIVPGGRFREIYYWDTYFTALGLCDDGHYQLVLDMFRNFQYLIEDNDCIPNGNRDYYRGRTQPPIMAMLLELLLSHKDKLPELQQRDFLVNAVDSLELEYQYWMQDSDKLDVNSKAQRRCAALPDDTVLNRYWDEHDGPRPESWREDQELAENLPYAEQAQFFTNIRAACESGWDFSSRWLAHADSLNSIRTTDIIPVDLNCLLWKLETSLSHYFEVLGENAKSQDYKQAAQQRANAIQRFFWNQETGFYMDWVFSESDHSEVFSLAGVLPLFMGIASKEQAKQVADRLNGQFLKPGGLVTTLTATPQQWDSPNGWAPLQWFTVIALENYGYHEYANQVMDNWLNNVETCLSTHGCMLEKYDVLNPGKVAGGGEYTVQTGFGWTNGVSRAFYKKRGLC